MQINDSLVQELKELLDAALHELEHPSVATRLRLKHMRQQDAMLAERRKREQEENDKH